MNTPRNLVLSALLVVAVLAAWEGGVRLCHVPPYILPPPSRLGMAMWRGWSSGIYAKHLGVTMLGTCLGFTVGCALAFVLGTAVAVSRPLDYFLYPYVVMFQSMPKVALAPLIVVWFGLGVTSKVVSAALIAFFPLMVNTIVGLRSADEERVNLMRSLDATEYQIFWMLRVPSALPFVMAGLEVAITLALTGTIVAEFVGAEAGLGMLIESMNFTMDVAGQFSILIVLAVVGLALNRGVLALRRRVLFWDASVKTAEGGETIAAVNREAA